MPSGLTEKPRNNRNAEAQAKAELTSAAKVAICKSASGKQQRVVHQGEGWGLCSGVGAQEASASSERGLWVVTSGSVTHAA